MAEDGHLCLALRIPAAECHWLDPGRNPGNTEMSSGLQGKHFPSAGFQLHMRYPSCFWFVWGFFFG